MSREEAELSEEAHNDQFVPEPKTGEPDMFTAEELEEMNAELEAHMGDPIDWESDIA